MGWKLGWKLGGKWARGAISVVWLVSLIYSGMLQPIKTFKAPGYYEDDLINKPEMDANTTMKKMSNEQSLNSEFISDININKTTGHSSTNLMLLLVPCAIDLKTRKTLTIVETVMWFILPCGIMAATYIAVVKKLWKTNANLMTRTIVNARRHSIRTMIVVFSVFILTWLPKRCVDMYAAYFISGPMLVTPWFQAVLWLCISQGWINVCVYCLMNYVVRKTLKKFVYQKCPCLIRHKVAPVNRELLASSSFPPNSRGSYTSNSRVIIPKSSVIKI